MRSVSVTRDFLADLLSVENDVQKPQWYDRRAVAQS